MTHPVSNSRGKVFFLNHQVGQEGESTFVLLPFGANGIPRSRRQMALRRERE